MAPLRGGKPGVTARAHTAAQRSDLQVLVLADPGTAAGLLCEWLQTTLPTTRVMIIDPVILTQHKVPDASCAVIDTTFGGGTGVETLRSLRAGGFAGSVVLLTDTNDDEEVASTPLGVARSVSRVALTERPTLLAEAVVAAAAVGEGSPGMRELRRTQRMIAAGEVAMGLQHAMNNPLTALLAEAQLLELEELPADQRASVGRIIQLSRRVIALVRGLDVIGPPARSS